MASMPILCTSTGSPADSQKSSVISRQKKTSDEDVDLNTDPMYMKLKREASLRPVKDTRETKEKNKVVNPYRPVAKHTSNIQYEKRKKAEGKRVRDDKDQVEEILFAMFEKHQYYNIKDLQRKTRQPLAYLKTILNKLCKYNVRNPHKNMWELRPEYRHYKNASDEGAKTKVGVESSDKDAV